MYYKWLNKIKYILNRIGNKLAQFLMWSDLNDFTNAFKIYKKEVLLKLNPLVSKSFNIFFEFEEKVSCSRLLGGAGPMVMVFDVDALIHGAHFVLGSSIGGMTR